MNSLVMVSELSLLMVNASITRPNGTMLNLKWISGTTFTYTTQVNSFGDNDVGNYTCNATVRPGPTATFLTGGGELSGGIEILIGEKQKQLLSGC